MRVRMAAESQPKRDRRKDQVSRKSPTPPVPAPETGSQPRRMEKMRIRMGPSAKFGNESPTERDDAERAVLPAIAVQRGQDPAGTETAIPIKSAASVSARV